jgi:hypothetical protein
MDPQFRGNLRCNLQLAASLVGEGQAMSLREMFSEDDARSFEERRDEVLSLVIEATDLSGQERYLRRSVHRCRRASTEQEFDQAYDALVDEISKAPLSA